MTFRCEEGVVSNVTNILTLPTTGSSVTMHSTPDLHKTLHFLSCGREDAQHLSMLVNHHLYHRLQDQISSVPLTHIS